MAPVKLIVIGAGSRGSIYSNYAGQHPDLAEIVGVAEPRDLYRRKIAVDYYLGQDCVFADWRELIQRDKFADAVIIATQDSQHMQPAVSFAAKGYHILLEKPMAPNEEDCRRIVEAALIHKIIFAVCHVLRYTNYTRKLKTILDSGRLGEVVSIQRLEPVGYWHQAHSFVRGNWGRESESSSMLLAKSCHDLDWIRYIMGCSCKKISSFGSLFYFQPGKKPAGAADRCLECNIEAQCPYSAKKIYLDRVKNGNTNWPVQVLTPELTVAGVTEALRTGPYGRCVWGCDNDVVDNQVVNMFFEGGRTASFTMTAFTEMTYRQTRIFCTRGSVVGDGSRLEVLDFQTDKTEIIDTKAADSSILGGHGGGDYNIMKSFVAAVRAGDQDLILSGPEESLESHLMVFAGLEVE